MPSVGYGIALGAAVAGGLIVAAGAAVCARSMVGFVRGGGWAEIRQAVSRSVCLTVATVAVFGAMAVWSRHLDARQRDGGYWPYAVLALVLAVVASAMIVSWTAAAATAVRRIEFSPRLVRRFGALAVALAVVTLLVVAGAALWCVAMASSAPWFFDGAAAGSGGSVVSPMLVTMGLLMAGAASLAVVGARSVVLFVRAAGPAEGRSF